MEFREVSECEGFKGCTRLWGCCRGSHSAFWKGCRVIDREETAADYRTC